MKLTLRPRAPFDFAATARFLRFTESEAVDVFTDNCYRRLFHFGERARLLNVESIGTRARPALLVSVGGKPALTKEDASRAEALVHQIFSTDHDLRRFRARLAGDPLMTELEASHRGLRLARWPTLFEALTVSILSQQISTLVAMTLKRRVVEKFGARLSVRGETFFAFPRAEGLARADVETLRALGLSGAKAVGIIEMAGRIADGDFVGSDLAREDNESVISRLTQLRGIGRWTAEWALMLHFGRTNVFPAGDLALRNFVIKYYNKGVPLAEREIRALAREMWGEWSSYAAVYFLAGMRAGTVNFRPEPVLLSKRPRGRRVKSDSYRPG